MPEPSVGLSGLAVYVPPYRVDLSAWCGWTGQPWEKIRNVVGRGFRMRGPEQSIYTLAANAVLRLIRQYQIDASTVRYLALGTESSTDNSAGAVIVKGMLNRALAELGLPLLPRACEVPEFKHACLGGVYGMKAAARYLASDGGDARAIVVAADIAEYARGSSGEATQGAGAVAMLLDCQARLARLDLAAAGSASDYRGADFRKPFSRYREQPARADHQLQDLPVFNGKFSTTCYVEATLRALEDMFARRRVEPTRCCRELAAVFMHRPYRRMPETGWALGYLAALAAGEEADRAELASYAAAAAVAPERLAAELTAHPDVAACSEPQRIDEEAYPLAMQVLRAFRDSPAYRRIVEEKMRLGSELMLELGNLYCGALPAWLAAGFEDALGREVAWAGREVLAIGYGSGDAAEAIPLRIAEDWRGAAGRIRFTEALAPVVELDRDDYQSLHERGELASRRAPQDEFIVERVGDRTSSAFCDAGIEYYRYVP